MVGPRNGSAGLTAPTNLGGQQGGSFRLGSIGLVALGGVLVCLAASAVWPTSAVASRSCGHRKVQTKIGPMRLYFRVQGPVRCAEARATIRRYFRQPGSECLGSGCFIHLPSGWNCISSPGEVTAHEGSVTRCSRHHGLERISTSRFPHRGFEIGSARTSRLSAALLSSRLPTLNDGERFRVRPPTMNRWTFDGSQVFGGPSDHPPHGH